MKFQVGDIVCGTSDEYGYTNTHMTRGEVTGIREDGKVYIKILEHTYGHCVGDAFPVDPDDFKLIKEIKKGDVKMTKNARKVKKDFEAKIEEMEQDFKNQMKSKDEEIEELQEKLTKKDREFAKKDAKKQYDHEMEIENIKLSNAREMSEKDIDHTEELTEQKETIIGLKAENERLESTVKALKKLGVSEEILAENSTLKAQVSGLEYTVKHITDLLDECRSEKDFDKVYGLIKQAQEYADERTQKIMDSVSKMIPDMPEIKVVSQVVTPEED